MILRATYIHSPRYPRRCSECGARLGRHIYLYGNADDGQPPSVLRLCAEHISASWAAKVPKIAAALEEATSRASDLAVETAKLEQWNAGQPKKAERGTDATDQDHRHLRTYTEPA